MATRASIARHPIHPMLIAFPIGLWGFSLFCDLAYHGGAQNVFWKDMAFYTMAGGFITALVAAVPGLVDYGTIIDRRVKQIGTSHLVLNLVVVALYAVNLWLRRGAPPDRTGPVWLSAVSLALLVVSGWLGAEMVHVYGVSVEPFRTSPTIDVTEPRAGREDVRRGA